MTDTIVHGESAMREETPPRCLTVDELAAYIKSKVDGKHDYGTCVYAMSLAATSAFEFVARELGVTGFQASCADMDFIRRTRLIKSPFMLVTADKMVYPQYDLRRQLEEAMAAWAPWAAKEAQEKLNSDIGHAHPDVIAHWRKLAESIDQAVDK